MHPTSNYETKLHHVTEPRIEAEREREEKIEMQFWSRKISLRWCRMFELKSTSLKLTTWCKQSIKLIAKRTMIRQLIISWQISSRSRWEIARKMKTVCRVAGAEILFPRALLNHREQHNGNKNLFLVSYTMKEIRWREPEKMGHEKV